MRESDSMSNSNSNSTVNIFMEGSPGANMGSDVDMPICGSREEYNMRINIDNVESDCTETYTILMDNGHKLVGLTVENIRRMLYENRGLPRGWICKDNSPNELCLIEDALVDRSGDYVLENDKPNDNKSENSKPKDSKPKVDTWANLAGGIVLVGSIAIIGFVILAIAVNS